jgi:hypothetical protein
MLWWIEHTAFDGWRVQMIARIHTNVEPVRHMIQTMLIRIGRQHPQAEAPPSDHMELA